MSQGTKGYIKLFRQIQECWIWDTGKFDKRSAWIDLLMLANHNEKKIVFNGDYITIEKGQYLTSIRNLATRWMWSTSTVSSFLRLLEADKMIKKESDKHRTLITIENYSVFQDIKYTKETPTDTPIDTPTTTLAETNNKLNTLNNTLSNDKVYNAQSGARYSEHFEEFWKIYKKKNDKSRAYANYNARLKEGFSEAELLIACKNYMSECEKEHRENRYIKDAKTFLSVNTPFIDYLPKGNSADENMEDGFYVYPIDNYYEANPPYFGFPEKWFDDGKLVMEKIKPIRQPADLKMGTNRPIDYSIEQLIQKYNERRAWYEQEHNGR